MSWRADRNEQTERNEQEKHMKSISIRKAFAVFDDWILRAHSTAQHSLAKKGEVLRNRCRIYWKPTVFTIALLYIKERI